MLPREAFLFLIKILHSLRGVELLGQPVGREYLQSFTNAVIWKARGNNALQVNQHILNFSIVGSQREEVPL